MVVDVSNVCFVGVYGHDQDDVLRRGFEQSDISFAEVAVPTHSLSEALSKRRIPILTMRGTINWFGDTPSWAFPLLVLGTLLVHSLATWLVALVHLGDLRRADALIVPHMGDTSVLFAKPLAVLLGVPLVYFSHNGLYFTLVKNRGVYPEQSIGGRTLFQIDRIIQVLSDRVVVFSEESARRFSETFDVPRYRYEVMYIGVDESKFDASDEGEAEHDCDVLYWGNFHPHHAPLTMVRAAAQLPEYDFVLAGESSKRDRVVREVESLEISNVSFPGYLSWGELLRTIQAAEVVLGPVGDNPQTEFTIGTKVAEAAYLEKAIIVGRQPSTIEVFEHERDAWLVSPGDSVALAEAIQTILSDSDLQRRLERGARDTYEAHFSTNRAAERVVQILRDAIR